MPESGILDEVTRLSTARRLTEHDRRMFMDDVMVNYIASQLARAMREYGVPKIAAAFRVALVWQAERMD